MRLAAQKQVWAEVQHGRHAAEKGFGKGRRLSCEPDGHPPAKSSQRWLRNTSPIPTKRRKAEGLRSRATDRRKLEGTGRATGCSGRMRGRPIAAPGGAGRSGCGGRWSDSGRVIALDILEVPSPGSRIRSDFRKDAVLIPAESHAGRAGGRPLSLSMNKSGMEAVDQPRAMHLAELAMEFMDGHLEPAARSRSSCSRGGLRLPAGVAPAALRQVAIRKPATLAQAFAGGVRAGAWAVDGEEVK